MTMYIYVHVRIREQLLIVSSAFLPCGYQGLSSDYQACRQVNSPTKPFNQPTLQLCICVCVCVLDIQVLINVRRSYQIS